MEKLRVRVYNVRFGDAILISVPDKNNTGKTETRHILVDMGNVLSGEGGDDFVFKPIIENIQQVLNNKPLDLYVMTHEHLDHVQGLLYAAEKLDINIKVRYAWLTASSEPNYYTTHHDSKKRMDEVIGLYDKIRLFLNTTPELETSWIHTMMLNNNPRSTRHCVEHLRALADKTAYVYRGFDLKDWQPFHEARFKIWAPEEDTSVYYGRFQPMTLGVAQGETEKTPPLKIEPKPPAGVDAGAFYNLVNSRRHGYVDNIMAIDRAANNTSVVFSLEWRNWKLLFAGDAEHRSWKTMNKYEVLEPVHFLKVSHHGSHTGLPNSELLNKILPEPAPDERKRSAVVCTYPKTYKDVPDTELLASELESRCEVKYVTKDVIPDGKYRDFDFAG